MRNVAHLIVLTVCLSLATGCGVHRRQIAVTPTRLPSCEKSHAKVALVLDTNFTRFEIQKILIGDLSVTPIGPALEDYARNVTGNVFSYIAVHGTPDEAAGKDDAILIPKVVKVEETYGVWAGSKRSLVLVVKWTMKDKHNQRDLWLCSVKAQAEGVMGNAFSLNAENAKVIRSMFEDLSHKTQKALLESAEVRQLGKPAP